VKNIVFWDVMLYSLVEFYWHFEGPYCLHLWGQRLSPAYRHCLRGLLTVCPWRWRNFSSEMSINYQTTQHHRPKTITTMRASNRYHKENTQFCPVLKAFLYTNIKYQILWCIVIILYRPSGRRVLAKLVPTFADRGCHVVTVTRSV
jgi:hypothetical protein